jgi:hypothetical protein
MRKQPNYFRFADDPRRILAHNGRLSIVPNDGLLEREQFAEGPVKALHGSFGHNATSWPATCDTRFDPVLRFKPRSERIQPPRLEILPARGPAPGDPRGGSTKFRRRM